MKFLLVLGLFVVACSAQTTAQSETETSLQAAVDAAKQACIDETGVPEAVVLRVRNLQPVISRKGKCYAACLMDKFQVMDENNYVDVEKTVQVNVPVLGDDPDVLNAARRVFTLCSANYEMDRCDFAHNFLTCIFRFEVTSKLRFLL
ncbi:general odorant-binding protein 19d-like [Condylostylus longicornis]|uniref:general odorant-binding protein 19d-like n=1 Tax=Condylostylus longicornis TaxID=2530218 RepID=UPI00244D9FDA|nr:general odorant-binding protein 19d-like [Condylostylus longicornis]